MNAFDVLGDPVRRRILELLREEDKSSGAIVEIISKEFGITQAGVSQHLKVLRDSGFATSSADGSKRIYHLEPTQFREVGEWLEGFRGFWHNAFDALAHEVRCNRPRE